jgi:predicted TIM-barrel fold metal-dependent hydrolase
MQDRPSPTKIVDADRHVIEPVAMWSDYLPAHMRELAPRVTPVAPSGESLAARVQRLGEHALLPTPPALSVRGQFLMRNVSEPAQIETGLIAEHRRHLLAAAETPQGHLTEMDATGVEVAVMLPTMAPFLVYNDETTADLSREYASAYNRWLADFCSFAPARFVGAALISRHDPETMVDDLEETLRRGLRAVVLRPNPVRGVTLGSPLYSQFWSACEHHSVAVLIHEGTHTRVSTAGADRFDSHFAQHACSHPIEAMMAFLSLIDGGVLESHPSLRVGFLESGCGWLPYWLWRLDHLEYAQLRGEVRARIRRPPSEYFQRQCWIALEPGEAMLDRVVTEIGASRIVFGTDFPHLDHGPGIVEEMVSERVRLGAEACNKILWKSPRRLLGIEV